MTKLHAGLPLMNTKQSIPTQRGTLVAYLIIILRATIIDVKMMKETHRSVTDGIIARNSVHVALIARDTVTRFCGVLSRVPIEPRRHLCFEMAKATPKRTTPRISAVIGSHVV